MADEKDNNEATAKAAAEAEKNRVKARDEQLKDEREAADDATDAQLDRVSSVKPTPTQEENDRARLGQTVEELDDKEDHGAAPIDQTRSTSADGAAGYSTRSTAPKK